MSLRAFFSICIAAVILSHAGRAKGDDPSIHWEESLTTHFRLIFPKKYRASAFKVAQLAERAHSLVVPLLGHAPKKRTTIVISSYTDQANGSATVYFRRTIRIFLTFPEDISELSDFDDWLWVLLVHEYTHIVHMDTMGFLPRLVNAIFGQFWVPNSMLPTWVIESLAVYSETKYSTVGRNRASIYSMYLRASVLAGKLLPLTEISSAPIPYPHGAIPYLYGSRFLWFLARKYGDGALKHLSASYGSSLIPFGLNKSARASFGKGFVPLYKEFSHWLKKKVHAVAARVKDRGIVRGVSVTTGGEFKFYPRFHPRKPLTLVYMGHSGHAPNALHMLTLDKKGTVKTRGVLHRHMVAPGRPSFGKGALFFHNLELHKRVYSFNDIYRLDLGSRNLSQISQGERLSDPSPLPASSDLIAVKSRATSSDLVLTDSHGKVRRVLLSGQGTDWFYTPEPSPDGKHVAFSLWHNGRRDIALLRLADGKIRTITDDRAMDTGPTFSQDGRWLLFSSDRTGIFNIYAYDLRQNVLSQVTNVLTGAFAPSLSSDGKWLAYAGYTHRGYEIFVMRFDQRRFLNPLPSFPVRNTAKPLKAAPRLPTSRYISLKDIAPVAWLADYGYSASDTVTLSMLGFDPLYHHSWSMLASLNPKNELGEVYLSYRNDQTLVPVDVSFTTGQYNKYNMFVNEEWRSYPWNYFKLDVAASIPLMTRVRHSLWGYLYGSLYKGLPREERPLPEPDSPLPRWPEGLYRGSLKGGAYFFNGVSSTYALDWERGLYIAAYGEALFYSNLSDPRLNLKFDSIWRTKLPLGNHTVLSARFTGGVSKYYDGAAFVIGGGTSMSPLRERPWSSPHNMLRGFPEYTQFGDHYYTASLYLTFPLAWIGKSYETLPFYLRRLHAKVFLDMGETFDAEWDWRRPLFGAGAELRLTIIQGWAVATDLVIGVTRGLDERGDWGFYFSLGSPLPGSITGMR